MSDVRDPWDALWDLIYDRLPESDLIKLGSADDFVEAIREAGWRPPAQVIETPESLAALLPGTVIRDANEEFHRLNPYGVDSARTWFPAWLSGNALATDFGQAPTLPAIVVWSPTEKATA
jgi:hypothetical protein